MKTMLMAIMAVVVAVAFSAPSFAEEKKKDAEKKGGHVVFAEEKKDEKKKDGKYTDTFGEEKKEEHKDKKEKK